MSELTHLACPHCQATHVVGVTVRGVYDGVLFWRCGHCSRAWPRFLGGDKLARLSREYVARYDARREA